MDGDSVLDFRHSRELLLSSSTTTSSKWGDYVDETVTFCAFVESSGVVAWCQSPRPWRGPDLQEVHPVGEAFVFLTVGDT